MKITAPTMIDLCAKIYAKRGWKREPMESRIARCQAHYAISFDFQANRLVAHPRKEAE